MLDRSVGVLAFSVVTLLVSTPAADGTAVTTVKALASAPQQFVNRAVTVTGRFRGRRPVVGALPPLSRSRWDFVLDMDDAAVWVSGIRPAGWDFDLDPLSPADASRGPWLEVTGTVRVDRRSSGRCATSGSCPQVWIQASDLRAAAAPRLPSPIRPALRPASVVFHDPVDGETGVPCGTPVRVQFSSAIVPTTLSERIRISYASPRPLAARPLPKFRADYQPETRAVHIVFEHALAAGQTVKVELLEGITAENGQRSGPHTFAFATVD